MKRNTIIISVAIVLGLGYGYVSGILNQNPYYPHPGETKIPKKDVVRAWHWQPSPVWLPSYLLCKLPYGLFGIRHTMSGYLFRSYGDCAWYLVASMFVGGVFGAIAGCAAIATIKLSKRRSSNQAN